ncbi:hypothetical protein [Planctellipticum variicoloris]|uniref:hypothetical protein n=1 Tax=Planctellipticum variicoloris TaxID=3064265 RepID=UPI003013E8C4|nr:hypothetical protein SH412_002963 [Planctomycetaceae bacterium SH412]
MFGQRTLGVDLKRAQQASPFHLSLTDGFGEHLPARLFVVAQRRGLQNAGSVAVLTAPSL